MAQVVPTVTEESVEAFHARILQLSQFSKRLHLDYADGEFAPRKLAPISSTTWPENLEVHMHIMYGQPYRHLQKIINARPHSVTIHAEASGNLLSIIRELQKEAIQAGIALLSETQPHMVESLILQADSVLVFGGRLGHQGGVLDESQLQKISRIKKLNPSAIIAWDGGINVDNAAHLVEIGVDVLNVGSAITGADDPKMAFKAIQAVIRD